ncbi:glycosyltransferase family 2 protein [Halomicrobium sp. LC1Hm]|uniref:glycosyltransferase family 2 protein n=1 Tax=Halomicrobium sp. LC1Hm TaxID=2610902 RepID=UPI001298457A|nr:glycosyltransferase family A protein [Halomicrobium sp. LC1Hm]QGA83582.1 Glycosyl transferase family 2 [Halomicrobium sp. LC1Hm]
MNLSVVVPTLNGREELSRCLDTLTAHVPDAETIVVNGPSADGTTGMVRARDDVEVLVEIADRTINTARNAGIDRATGDAVALLDRSFSVEDGWLDAVTDALGNAAVVTGPTHRKLPAGMTTEAPEERTIAGRDVTYFNPGNVAFASHVLDELDGFDEYLDIGGSRDLAHRLAESDHEVTWESGMCVRSEFEADGGIRQKDWHAKYQSLTYRLVKNYGVRPTVARRVVAHAGRDAVDSLVDVIRGEADPSQWLGTGRRVLRGTALGGKDGVTARRHDAPPRRNPNGRSARRDRAVEVYDDRDDSPTA